MSKTHAMQDIRDGAMTPMKAKPLAVCTRDDTLAGTMLAASVLAYAANQDKGWIGFAKQAVELTTEGRVVVLNQLKARKAEMTKAAIKFGIEEKTAKNRTAGFAVAVSMFGKVVHAFNSGGTVEGWMEFVNSTINDKEKHCTNPTEMWEHASYRTLVDYARTFSTSNAGAKPQELIVKLGKFIEAAQKTGNHDTDPLMQELVDFYKSKA